MLSRRSFLGTSAAVALSPLAAAIDPIKRPDKPKLQLSLAAYSFRQKLDLKKPSMTLFEFIRQHITRHQFSQARGRQPHIGIKFVDPTEGRVPRPRLADPSRLGYGITSQS